MTNSFIAVRDVNAEIFRKFKARAIENRIKVGEALSKAMRESLNEKTTKKSAKILLEIKPFDFGKGTERTSEEIDEILYS